MTQFYVPFVRLADIDHDEVVAAAPPGTIFVDVSSSPLAYWEALCEWWAKGEDFAIIEHDVLCRPDVVEAFDACPEPWCVFSYQGMCHDACREAWANMFGCTRYRAALIAAVPEAVSSIPPQLRDWHNLCDGLAGMHPKCGCGIEGVDRPGSLRAHGYGHHWHTPHVAHHPWFVSR